MNYITSYCTIEPGKVSINGETVYTGESGMGSVDFLKSVYKNFQIAYPKFYKMDHLSKLAFVTSELLLRTNPITQKYNTENIALVIENSASSLETDTDHQNTITDKDNFFPSPAIFVYTLPNILIGEIAIRNSIKGENSLFIFEHFNAGFMSDYLQLLFNRNTTEACITGYVDYYEDHFKAFLYTVEKTPGTFSMEHTSQNLTQLFNK